MTPNELRYLVEKKSTSNHFFNPETLRFFGDIMANYGVVSTTITILDSWDNEGQPIYTEADVWELFRKKPVKHALKNSAYFRKDNFKRVHDRGGN